MEDDPILHKLYWQILTQQGFRVVGGAYNGNECIEKINNSTDQPDFIIMDNNMPIKNGLDTMKDLLKSNPALKIIFISAEHSIKKAALSAGAVSFITKPFDLHHLFKSINDLLDNYD